MSRSRTIKQQMIVAGVMSGTSADGINVALVRIGILPQKRGSSTAEKRTVASVRSKLPSIGILGHVEYSYPKKVRAAILAAMNASRISVAELSRLNFLLGELYAEAVLATQNKFKVHADLIGCHGQTIYHQGEPQVFLGRRVATTWQTGEGAVIAVRTRIPVVSDFRPADMAAGGKGAPLVPFLDYLLFRDARMGRIVQNIGGIANLTVIPPGASADQVIAFDTGPGNMVIDALTHILFNKPFDAAGKIAASGTVLERVLSRALHQSFFCTKPPKTAGREEFGREFVQVFLRSCGRCRKQDAVATATALTAQSIVGAVERFVIGNKNEHQSTWEMIASGGGTRNSTLMGMLADGLSRLNIRIIRSDELGLPSEAKEAAAFAILAHETWHRRPSNIPSATGAHRPAILGKISYP